MISRCSFPSKLLLASVTIYCGLTAPVMSQSKYTAQFKQSETSTWRPILLQTLDNIKVAAPPNKQESEKELAEIKQKMAKVDEKMMQTIKYWDAGPPSYRWNQIATKLVTFKDIKAFFRFPTSWINIAIYDATLATWKAKYNYNRKRPFQADARIIPVVTPPSSPSYPCEHTVTAAAAATVLAYFFPEISDSILQLGKESAQSRVYAGIQYPSDVAEGWKLGEQIAGKIIEEAKKDGSDIPYTDPLPNDPKLWHGDYPVGIQVRNYKPITLKSGDQFRPPAPPEFADEMKEMKAFKQDFRSTHLALYWASLTGFDIWTELASRKIFEERLDRNTLMCARIYALMNVVMYDASIAIMDAKYAYWGIRPNMYDTSYRPLIHTPPFPGYPSGHATASSAAATVLSYFFPSDKAFFKQTAEECADSRFYAGIHFKTDNKVGTALGEKLATFIIDEWARQNASGKK